jgi:hypothetical protein
MQTIKQAWSKTAGHKMASGGFLLLIFQLIKMIWGTDIPDEWQEWILNAITAVAATGAFDKLWRNRKLLIQWIRELFRKKQADETQ